MCLEIAPLGKVAGYEYIKQYLPENVAKMVIILITHLPTLRR